MLATFESILPVFLLIVAGNLLRRLPIVDQGAWAGLDQIGFWFLYPSLLFITIANADFSGLAIDATLAALLLSVAVMSALSLGVWPLLRGSGLIAASEFSSVFQTAIRWNGFMALAIAQKIFPPAGSAVVALVMAVIIIPINLQTVLVVTRFADRGANMRLLLSRMIFNPMILAALFGLLARALPFTIYPPLMETLDLVGRAALGMGLIAIGAGLRLGDLFRPRLAAILPVVLKLFVFPALVLAISLAFGIRGAELSYLALCAAVPTAMNGYLLARQMGGDAELYAAVTTLQTAVSFFSIPLILAVTAQISG